MRTFCVTIKASGDFTRYLFNHLKPGMAAVVEGAYGMFDYRTGGQKQVWIAGGIGLTPFLSFLRDMDGNLAHDVDFYYTVRHPEEALFLDEIETAPKGIRAKPHVRWQRRLIERIIFSKRARICGSIMFTCVVPCQ
jgi:predicted ferric reductase